MIASALSKHALPTLALTLALMLALTGCSNEPSSPLRIGTNVWIGSEPLYLARDLGHFDLKVVQYGRVPIGQRSPARLSQPGDRRHGDQHG